MTRLPRLRFRLMLLAAASILPVLLLSLALGYFLIQHEKEMFRQAAIGRTRAFLTAVDAQIEGHMGTLHALSASSSLESGNLQAFHDEAGRVLASQPDWRNILLLDANGRQLVNLGLPYGAQLPSETDGIPIRMPVLRNDEVRYVVECILKPEALMKLLQREARPCRAGGRGRRAGDRIRGHRSRV